MFLLVPAHPGFPGQIPQSRKTVVVCVCVLAVACSKNYSINTPWPFVSYLEIMVLLILTASYSTMVPPRPVVTIEHL